MPSDKNQDPASSGPSHKSHVSRHILAFTLLELLVVLAVIGLLAALHRAKMKAQQVACLSNQRQINLDFRMRVDDAGGRLGELDDRPLPDVDSGPRISLRSRPTWVGDRITVERQPDMDSPGGNAGFRVTGRTVERGWICPSAPPPSAGALTWTGFTRGTVRLAWIQDDQDGFWGTNIYAGSYGLNNWLIMNLPPGSWSRDDWIRTNWPEAGQFRFESNVAQPAFTPVLADGTWWVAYPGSFDAPPPDLVPVDWTTVPFYMAFFCIPRHGSRPNPVPTDWPPDKPLPGAVNVSFFDGHGELVKLDRLWQLYWHKNYQPPDKRPGLP